MMEARLVPGFSGRLKAILFVAVLFLLAALVVIFRGEIVVAFSQHYHVLLLVAGIIFFSLGLQAYNFLQMLGANERFSLVQTWHTWAAANLANYLGPFQPGLAVRMAYFRGLGVPVVDTVRATLRQLVLSLWVGSGMTAIGLFSNDAGIRLFAVFGCLLFIASPWIASGLRATIPSGYGNSRIVSAFRSLLELCRIGMPVYRLWPFVMQYILMAVCFYAAYNEFGVNLGADESILLAVIFAMSVLVALTPNNLGVQELLLGYVAFWGGLGSGEALGVALIFRVAHLLACGVVLLVTFRR